MTSSNGLPIVVIACKVFQSLLEKLMPADMAEQVTFMDYGLHRVPSKLTWAVQDAIDAVEHPSLIVLGYGLCGNGLKGINARQHTLLIPRTDDCIAILLGSYKKYIQEFDATPGTYYLTKGWLEAGSNPLQEYEEIKEKYGEKDATWIMDQQYQHYERLLFVAHNQADLDEYRPQAQEVAEYCQRWGYRYEEILGSDIYVRRLIEVAMAIDKTDSNFVVIPPSGEVTQNLFMR
ncbi:MAG: DUF1638 domain-containing protein [Chloroflexi bacterium]|nr:DUF1638 domain-containing protein [Chloroflexota bacterium]